MELEEVAFTTELAVSEGTGNVGPVRWVRIANPVLICRRTSSFVWRHHRIRGRFTFVARWFSVTAATSFRWIIRPARLPVAARPRHLRFQSKPLARRLSAPGSFAVEYVRRLQPSDAGTQEPVDRQTSAAQR